MVSSSSTSTRSIPCPICDVHAPVIETVRGVRLGQFQLRDSPQSVSTFDAVVHQCQNCDHYFISNEGGGVSTQVSIRINRALKAILESWREFQRLESNNCVVLSLVRGQPLFWTSGVV